MRFLNSLGSFANSDGLVLAEAAACSSLAVPDFRLVSASMQGLFVAASVVKASVALSTGVEKAAPSSAAASESPTTAALVFEFEAALL